MSKYTQIVGWGSYLPLKSIKNTELSPELNTSDEWIQKRTGIKKRWIAEPPENVISMGVEAARNAMAAASIDPSQIGLVIAATSTAEHVFPSTACSIQAQLGLMPGPAFDLQAACSGFVYAVGVADHCLRSGMADCALVVCSEAMTRLVSWQDRSTCVLFGDGAGAVLIKKSSTLDIPYVSLGADGRFADILSVRNWHGCFDKQLDPQAYALQMDGPRLFRLAVETIVEVFLKGLEASTFEKNEIDFLVLHQANIRILQAVSEKINFPFERMLCAIDEHSNTSCASIPLVVDQALKKGVIQKGNRLFMIGFGGGFTWGSIISTIV